MKFEFSAGGVVYKREMPLSEDARNTTKNIVVLVCQHSQHHGWVFPKGLIGEKLKIPTSPLRSFSEGGLRGAGKSQKSKVVRETKEEAALREVKEETGVSGKIIKPLTPVTYWYKFDNEKIKKTVYYFLMEYVSGDTKDHDFEMENVEWLPIGKVEERLTYPSDKKIWEEAKKLIAFSN